MSMTLERTQVRLYPTATVSDVLFYVKVDSRIPRNKDQAEYGDLFRDLFPNAQEGFESHRLVYIKPFTDRDGGGDSQLWYFAADRANQDDYNWSLNGGSELIRDYLVPRDAYYERTEAEAGSDEVTDEFFCPEVPEPDVRFPSYGFADDTVVDAPEELRSRYIIVRRRHLRPVTVEIGYEKGLDLRIRTTRTLVPAATGVSELPANGLGYAYELQPENTFHSVQIKTEMVPSNALATFIKSYPVAINIKLPRELVSVGVVWNTASSIGTQDFAFAKVATGDNYSLSGSGSDQASSSASITADIQPKFRDIDASNLSGLRHEFFVENPVTEAKVLAGISILAGITASKWPTFLPVSETITATGQGVKISCNASAGLESRRSDGVIVQAGWDRGVSDDYSVSLGSNSVELGPCIHGFIELAGGTSRMTAIAATAIIELYHSDVGTITSTKTKTGTAYGVVTPASLAATPGQNTIPTSGYYLMGEPDVRDYGFGYSRVIADTFNAADLT